MIRFPLSYLFAYMLLQDKRMKCKKYKKIRKAITTSILIVSILVWKKLFLGQTLSRVYKVCSELIVFELNRSDIYDEHEYLQDKGT